VIDASSAIPTSRLLLSELDSMYVS